MGLPVSFCKKHLPQKDTYFILENQNGKEYKTHYLARKTAISGGWRGFAIAESFLEGDALVFHLVSPAKFKVYIIRESDLSKVDTRTERVVDVCAGTKVLGLNPQAEVENFSEITSFEDFIVVLDEVLKKEYELPHHIKWSYYQLCCTQNVLLHAHLPKLINPVLIAGIIIETVNSANAIRNCEPSRFQDEFAILAKNLNSLQLLGMNVGFLRTHLHRLQSIADDPEVAMYRQQCTDLCSTQVDADKEIKSLQAKLSEMRRSLISVLLI